MATASVGTCLSGAWNLFSKNVVTHVVATFLGAVVVGISYPPALLLLVAVVIVLVKTLHTDIVNTRVERDVRRLNQRLAILEADNAALRELR